MVVRSDQWLGIRRPAEFGAEGHCLLQALPLGLCLCLWDAMCLVASSDYQAPAVFRNSQPKWGKRFRCNKNPHDDSDPVGCVDRVKVKSGGFG